MERCGLHLYRGSRRSFETAHAHGEAPPRLQVIGFDVQAPAKGAGGTSASVVLRPTIKPAASSPRASALQQLLLHQSLPSTSSPSSNDHSLPPPLPPPSASSPPAAAANHMTFTPAFLPSNKPTASSSPSPNPCLPCGLLPPATSPPAANQKSTGAGLLQPPADHPNSMSSQSLSASAYHSNSSSGRLKSMLQSQCASSHAPANPSSRTRFLISVGQSQCANPSSSSSSSGLSVLNMQMINQHDPDRSKALIKENHGIKQEGDAKPTEFNGENDAKAPMISATDQVINELPYPDVTKSTKSSWFHGNIGRPISPAQCHDSSWKGLQQIIELPSFNEKNRKSSRNEEKSKKSSVFVLVASSPAAEFHPHHHHQAEYHASRNMDFLSSCHLCRRLLGQGQDIFMYSGDKAFCSMECRYEQIAMDERKERCPPPIIRSGASQVYQHSSVTATTTHHPIIINKPQFINTAAAA